MSSPSAVVCHEIFDENSQPSAEEVSEYATQLGIDPDSESHLLPLARDGLMQALPSAWKAYYDDKLQTHYYYNEESKKTQWEHPLDHVYRELVKKARDASMQDDTCASVQELPTSEEITKHLERVETKVESDEELSTDSENHQSDVKESPSALLGPRRLAPLGRPPLSPLTRLDKKLGDIRISPLRRSADSPILNKPLLRNASDRELLSRQIERPKALFKQHSEVIDLKMQALSSPEEEFPMLTGKMDRGLTLSGKGNMFLKLSKSDLPSPDTEKSLPLDSITKSDPPKGILREKIPNWKEHVPVRPKTASFDDDRKSVRFKLENPPESTISPGSNSSSEQNDKQSSIISATPHAIPPVTSHITSSVTSHVIPPVTPHVMSPVTSHAGIVLSPLASRPPLPPRFESPRDSVESDSHHSRTSPRRRVLRPPAGDYIKPDLFQKSFQKISDLVRPDLDSSSGYLEEPVLADKEARPRSPMIPQKNKISINLMESIESETSIDSPDREFANLDLNDLNDLNEFNTHDTVTQPDNKDEDSRASLDSKSSRHKESLDSKVSIESKSSRLRENSANDTRSSRMENIPQIKVPSLDLKIDTDSRSEDTKPSKSIDISKSPIIKISPITSDLRSPRLDFSKPWSPLSSFKAQNATKTESPKGPRLDGVMLSQGKSSSGNVVVVYQFENQEETQIPMKSPLNSDMGIKSPLIPDMGRDIIERNKADERRRLEISLQKELEGIRIEWSSRERKMRAELQEELKETEEKFLNDKRMRLSEQRDRQQRDMKEELEAAEREHHKSLQHALLELEDKYKREMELIEERHKSNMETIQEQCKARLFEQQRQLEIENERTLSELHAQFQESLARERSKLIEANRTTIESLKEEHAAKVADLRHDYRAEVERLRTQHMCHVSEVRARLSHERAAVGAKLPDPHLLDKYRCLKEKYARLKHDVKMSLERRNKRREMSMTTGSETEKSNSHKGNQSLERCKELNESVSASVPPESCRSRPIGNNDNETSHSETNHVKSNDNNNHEWKFKRENVLQSADTSQTSGSRRANRRVAVAFKEPPNTRRRHADTRKDIDNGATTDCQDSSDATTADEKPKEPLNGHGRRRCFTRLKSASTSRLNYSPKRGEGWSSPLESLRQQLRKLDDLEDQFPDLACQPAYSLRYPFSEIGAVATADTPELEFVRHRALIEREGMRRARAVLKRRRAALRETRASLSPHRAPSEERESTELEVALHRARALLGEKEIRLRHIERALRQLAPLIAATAQEGTSEASSCSSPGEGAQGNAGGAVLRSLRALHADVRDIWRALDARRPHTASPETSSCNAATTSQARMTLSAPDPIMQNNSDGGVSERARGLRAWLQTTP